MGVVFYSITWKRDIFLFLLENIKVQKNYSASCTYRNSNLRQALTVLEVCVLFLEADQVIMYLSYFFFFYF